MKRALRKRKKKIELSVRNEVRLRNVSTEVHYNTLSQFSHSFNLLSKGLLC